MALVLGQHCTHTRSKSKQRIRLAPGTGVDVHVGLDHLVNRAIRVTAKLDGLQVLGEQERSAQP